MTLRRRLIITSAGVSLLSATAFSVSLLLLTRNALSAWDSPSIGRALDVAVGSAVTEADRTAAAEGRRDYHQLRVLRGLVEGRVWIAGVLFGLAIFGLSAGVSSLAVMRMTRPLKTLAGAIERAGRGDLAVRVDERAGGEVGTVAAAFNRMTARLAQLQEELRRTERLAAWRDVARILGHEVRNPLTPIRLSVERLQLKARDGSPELPRLIESSSHTILEEIDVLDRIVREFSEFARLPGPSPVTADLNALLADVAREYASLAPGAVVETEFDPSLSSWRFDPGLIRRAAGNIVKNSFEALAAAPPDGGGMLRVTTRRNDACAVVTITDNGPGMPPDARARAFEPYFTTKTKGTGLGLAVARNVVADHGGTIRLADVPAGTEVIIELPQGTEEHETANTGS